MALAVAAIHRSATSMVYAFPFRNNISLFKQLVFVLQTMMEVGIEVKPLNKFVHHNLTNLVSC